MIPHNRLLILAIVISFAANWQFGYQITYINTSASTFHAISAVARFRDCVSSTNLDNITSCDPSVYPQWPTHWSTIVASFYPGTFLGFILVPYLVRSVGVKKALLYSCAPAVLGCLLQLVGRVASRLGEPLFIADLVLGRFLVGIHAGSALCLLPLFTIEVSPEESRPFISTLQQVSQAFATLLGLIIGSNDLIPLGENRFELLQIIAVVPTVIFVFLLIKLPKTPFYVVDTMPSGESNEENLRESLAFYYNNDSETTVDEVKSEAFSRWSIDDTTPVTVMKQRENVKGLMIGCLAAISYAFTADDIIDSYSSQILNDGGVKNIDQLVTVIYGVLLVVASIFGSFLIDRFGRKKLLITGLVATSGCNFLALTGFLINLPLLEIVGFGLTKVAIGLGAGAPAWFLTSELVSPQAVSLCQSLSTGSLLIMAGFLTFVFPPLNKAIGIYSLFFLAIMPAFFIAGILVLFLPETKDKTHEAIRIQLGSNLFSGLEVETLPTKKPKGREKDPLNLVGSRRNSTLRQYGTMTVPPALKRGKVYDASDASSGISMF
uniref:MFS domain-containing protein n=1 Tax=Panagrellus redivivus TaxID=6233 RepID=A0A7E4UU12_PANRE